MHSPEGGSRVVFFSLRPVNHPRCWLVRGCGAPWGLGVAQGGGAEEAWLERGRVVKSQKKRPT